MPTSASTTDTTTRAKGIDYGIDAWKVTLIDSRARLRGYRHDELDEVRQELVPILFAFFFDAAKSNGACERTVLISVIDNQLNMALRTRARYQLLRGEFAADTAKEEQARIERREVAHEVEADRREDVGRALATMWEKDRDIAVALMQGDNLHVITKRTGKTRYELERAVDRIREHFLACGLDAWVRG